MSYNTPDSSLALLTDPALEVGDKHPCARCGEIDHADDMTMNGEGALICDDCYMQYGQFSE